MEIEAQSVDAQLGSPPHLLPTRARANTGVRSGATRAAENSGLGRPREPYLDKGSSAPALPRADVTLVLALRGWACIATAGAVRLAWKGNPKRPGIQFGSAIIRRKICRVP